MIKQAGHSPACFIYKSVVEWIEAAAESRIETTTFAFTSFGIQLDGLDTSQRAWDYSTIETLRV